MSHNANYVVFSLLSLQPFLEYGVIRKKRVQKTKLEKFLPFSGLCFRTLFMLVNPTFSRYVVTIFLST